MLFLIIWSLEVEFSFSHYLVIVMLTKNEIKLYNCTVTTSAYMMVNISKLKCCLASIHYSVLLEISIHLLTIPSLKFGAAKVVWEHLYIMSVSVGCMKSKYISDFA